MKYEDFIKIIGKYIDLSLYDIRFKKSPYYKNENEMWLYRKDDEGYKKNVVIGYKMNDKFYKTRKALRDDFKAGRNDYQKVYSIKNYRIGLLIREDDLQDEEYLNGYLNG